MRASNQQSAFKVGGRIEDPYFIDRRDTQDVLLRDARTLSQSHVIIAPRRFGKTALLQRLCSGLSGEMLASYVNCLPLHRPDVFHDRIVESILDAFERRHGRARRLLATWKEVLRRPIIDAWERLEEIGGSVQSVGSIRLKFRTQEADADELLRAALEFPERFSEEQGESVLLALDELQALAPLGDGLFSLFEGAMDSQRRVCLFSGSSLTLLSDVFAREGESPLYQMVGRTFLGELDPASVSDFVKRRLREVHGAEMTDGAAMRFLERVGGIPYYVQKLGVLLEHRLALRSGDILQEADVEGAFGALLDEIDLDFQERWTTRFSDQQRAILLALSRGAASSGEIASVPPPRRRT